MWSPRPDSNRGPFPYQVNAVPAVPVPSSATAFTPTLRHLASLYLHAGRTPCFIAPRASSTRTPETAPIGRGCLRRRFRRPFGSLVARHTAPGDGTLGRDGPQRGDEPSGHGPPTKEYPTWQ